MSVETTAPFRRVVGTLIRGVADGLLGGVRGIPLAGAQVTATASVKSAASGEFIVLDPVDGTTDQNARLRNAATGEDGILLLVTDDPSIGVIGWTWHITVTAPSLNRPGKPPRVIEFDIDVPTGEGDLDLATLVPVPGNIGEDVILWRAAVEQTQANLEMSNSLVQDTVIDGVIDGDVLVLKTRGGDEIRTSSVRGPGGQSAYEIWLTQGNTGTVEDWQEATRGQDGSNVVPTDEAIAGNMANPATLTSGALLGNVTTGPVRTRLESDFVLRGEYTKSGEQARAEIRAAAALYVDFEKREVLERGFMQGASTISGTGYLTTGNANLLPVPFSGGSVSSNTLPSGWEWHQASPTKVLQSLSANSIAWRGTSPSASPSSLGGLRTIDAVVAPGQSMLMSFDAAITNPVNVENPVSLMTLLLRTTDSAQTAGARAFTLGEEPQRVVTKLTAPETGSGSYKAVIMLIGGSPTGGFAGQSVTGGLSDFKMHIAPGTAPRVGERWGASHATDLTARGTTVAVDVPAGIYLAAVRTAEFGWTVLEYVHSGGSVNLQNVVGPNANLDVRELAILARTDWREGWMDALAQSLWSTARTVNQSPSVGHSTGANQLAKALGTVTNESVVSSEYEPSPHQVAPSTRYAAAVDIGRDKKFRFEVKPGERAASDVAAGRNAFRSEVAVTNSLPFDTDEWFSGAFHPLTAIRDVPPRYGSVLVQYRYKNNATGDTSSLSPEIQFEMIAGSKIQLRVRTDGGTPVLSGDAMPPGTTTAVFGPWDYEPGDWFDVVMRIRFSKSGGGYLGFWLNGQTIHDGPHAVGYNRDRGPSLRFGAYSYATDPVTVEYRNLERSPLSLAHRITRPLPH